MKNWLFLVFLVMDMWMTLGLKSEFIFPNKVMLSYSMQKKKQVMKSTIDWQWCINHLSLFLRQECRTTAKIRGERSMLVFQPEQMSDSCIDVLAAVINSPTCCLSGTWLYPKELAHACLTAIVLVHVYKRTVHFPHVAIRALRGLKSTHP